MSDSNKAAIEINIPLQIADSKEESTKNTSNNVGDSAATEMPTITTLLQRKKLEPSKETLLARENNAGQPTVDLNQISVQSEESSEPTVAPSTRKRGAARIIAVAETDPQINSVSEVEDQTRMSTFQSSGPLRKPLRKPGEPPVFSGTLFVEKLDLKMFQKQLKAHKKSANMKKLDCISFFASIFSEVTFFQVNQPGSLSGVLGYGNSQLVTGTKQQTITPQTLPSIFEVLAQSEIFVGPIEGLRADDQAGFTSLGFSGPMFVGAFPMIYKKSVTGLWLCAAPNAVELSAKDIKTLKKIFSDLLF
jgi:hypothetical protein